MALVQTYFFSQSLGMCVSCNVILPQREAEHETDKPERHPTLWLLHGMSDDETIWERRTSIERYAGAYGLAVVMPCVHLSSYADMAHGGNYYTYIAKELPLTMRSFFPLSDRREDNFIAGLSMGGRGAVKYAVNHPEKFAAAAILSASPMDLNEMRPGHPHFLMDTDNPRMQNTFRNAGGMEQFIHSNENVWAIIDRLAPTGTLPRLMFACGEEDPLVYENFKAFRKHCGEIGLKAYWFTRPGYAHEWRFWDLAIQEALTFFGL